MTFVRRLGTFTSRISLGIVLTLAGLISAGCRGERTPPPPSKAGQAAVQQVDSAEVSNTTVQWDPAAGGALVLAQEGAGDSAMIVRPEYTDSEYDGWDPAKLRPMVHSRWDLFGRSGFFGTGQLNPGLAPPPADDACLTWPPATVSTNKPGWRVALESGRATAIPLDSVEALSHADSARFIVEVTRLASSTHGPADSLFASIPFVVRTAYRFRTGAVEGILASVQRSILSEANPREEHLFLIAERPVGSSEAYRLVYTNRNAGSERGVALIDVLAAVTLSTNHRIALVASHEYDDGGEIWFIERVAPGRWRTTWESATTGC